MTRESFAGRVESLRDAWAERRRVARFSGSHDLASQAGLLATLHGWAAEAVRDIAAVYGDGLDVEISPLPDADGPAPAFAVTIASEFAVNFALAERRRIADSRWHVSVSVRSPGASVAAHAGPERRNGQWTRGRLEDVLLSVLGAYERSLGSSGAAPATAAGPGRKAEGGRLAV